MRSFKVTVIVVLILMLAVSSAYIPNQQAYALAQNEEPGLFSGIVKENNPSLGYITLYFQDGSGADTGAFNRLVSLRNFTYGYEIPVIRDGVTVKADNIQPGDQVFIKLDSDGYITKLSAKSYYRPVYGTVYLKSAKWLVLKKDNGTFVSYPMTPTPPIYKNNRASSMSDILPGDRVKLLVQTNGTSMDIAGIEIEKLPKPITGVYRGYVEFFDPMRDSLAVSGVQEFVNGQWENHSVIGIQSFGFSSDYKTRPLKKFAGMAYFAIKKSNDGSDRIIMASYRNRPNYELAVKDNLLSLTAGKQLELENSSDIIDLDQGTIVIKDGRLVDISAVNTLDPVKISMEKSPGNNEYLANVLVSDSAAQSGLVIYRGRIKSIEPEKSVTVESFAQLNGITWSFTNTPKTFDIDLNSSRLLEDDGIGNLRELGSGYIGKSVYIAAVGSKIKIMSTAQYADSPVSGRVLSLSGATYDSNGSPLTDPTGLVLTQANVFDTQTQIWSNSSDITVNIPTNAIVLKKGIVGTTSLIRTGDDIKIIRHSQSREGILVICD